MPGLVAPFPYFGGKSSVAEVVWRRFGDPRNYVEPFFGSGAVLLARPGEPTIETVNDIDGLLTNFWRAVKKDPSAVAEAADWPVSEIDLHARHMYLLDAKEGITEKMISDPNFFDPEVAGWWVWGMSTWLGHGFCSERVVGARRPHLSTRGHGVHRTIPSVGTRGRGIHRTTGSDIEAYMLALSHRLRRTRIVCGDWSRVLTRSVTTGLGETAVFLDPPYDMEIRDNRIYDNDMRGLSDEVREWAIEHGEEMKIALCGYDIEHKMPSSWRTYKWKTQGGYANTGDGRGRKNKGRERIWFSPSCLQTTLFEYGGLS